MRLLRREPPPEEFVTVVYELQISVHEDDPIPTEDELERVVYQAFREIRSEDAVIVRRY